MDSFAGRLETKTTLIQLVLRLCVRQPDQTYHDNANADAHRVDKDQENLPGRREPQSLVEI